MLKVDGVERYRGAATSNTVNNLSNTSHIWLVQATDYNNNTSSASGPTFTINSPPTQVGAINAPTVGTTGATISWGASSDPNGDTITYEVEYGRTDVWDGWTSAGTTTSTSRSLSGLYSDSRYTVRVRATDSWGGVSGWQTADPLFRTLPEFAPTFYDARITNRVDLDGDGYARSFDIEFDVNSNIAGSYYVKVWEYDNSTLGLDDYLTTSSTFAVDGSDIDYQTVHINCDNYPGTDYLSHGTAEIKLELFDAATSSLKQTWWPTDDASLGNVNVEVSSEDHVTTSSQYWGFIPGSSSTGTGTLDQIDVFVEGWGANGRAAAIQSTVNTWVIVHGRADSSSSFQGLATDIAAKTGEQVLLLDWAPGAADNVPLGLNGAGWIPLVANWAETTLNNTFGISNSLLRLVPIQA